MRSLILATAILCASCAIPTAAFANPDTGIQWQASVSSYGAQPQRQRAYRQPVQQVRVARYQTRRQAVAARYSPPIARTPLAIPAQIIQVAVQAASTGVAIVDAMAADLGKNLRRNYGGMPYCGFYMGTIVQRLGFKPPAQHGWAPNWVNFGVAAAGPAPGVIMVTRAHVGIVKAVLPNGMVVLRGGNQGASLVRDIVVPAHPHNLLGYRRPA